MFVRVLLVKMNLSVSTFTMSVYGKLKVAGMGEGRTLAVNLCFKKFRTLVPFVNCVLNVHFRGCVADVSR